MAITRNMFKGEIKVKKDFQYVKSDMDALVVGIKQHNNERTNEDSILIELLPLNIRADRDGVKYGEDNYTGDEFGETTTFRIAAHGDYWKSDYKGILCAMMSDVKEEEITDDIMFEAMGAENPMFGQVVRSYFIDRVLKKDTKSYKKGETVRQLRFAPVRDKESLIASLSAEVKKNADVKRAFGL